MRNTSAFLSFLCLFAVAVVGFAGCKKETQTPYTHTRVNEQWAIVKYGTALSLQPLTKIDATYYLSDTYVDTTSTRKAIDYVSFEMEFNPKPSVKLSAHNFDDDFSYQKYKVIVIPKGGEGIGVYAAGYNSFGPNLDEISSQSIHDFMINNAYVYVIIFGFDFFETPTSSDTLITTVEFKLNCMGYTEAFEQMAHKNTWH